jgi:hypothetical protein
MSIRTMIIGSIGLLSILGCQNVDIHNTAPVTSTANSASIPKTKGIPYTMTGKIPHTATGGYTALNADINNDGIDELIIATDNPNEPELNIYIQTGMDQPKYFGTVPLQPNTYPQILVYDADRKNGVDIVVVTATPNENTMGVYVFAKPDRK